MLGYQGEESIPSDEVDSQVEELDSLPLLHVESLKSAWPHGKSQERASIQFSRGLWMAGGLANARTIQTLGRVPSIPNSRSVESDDATVGKPELSLRSSALDSVIQSALDIDDISWVEEAEQLQGFTEHLRSYLQQHPDAVNANTSPSLLTLAFRGCPQLNFNPFPGLTFKQILQIVATIQEVESDAPRSRRLHS